MRRVFLLGLLALPALATAEGGERRLTASWSPAPLLAGVVQGSLEYRMAPLWSGVVLGGAGGFTYDDGNPENVATRFRIRAAGLQLRRYYRTETPRHEPHYGLQFVWISAETDEPPPGFGPSIEADLSVGSIGPFMGYKYSLPSGLALEAQLGALLGSARNHLPYERQEGVLVVLPWLNLGIGWSF